MKTTWLLVGLFVFLGLLGCGGGGADIPSPAKGKIAFVSGVGGNNDIYVMNAAGGTATRLTNNTRSNHPSWSPDGTKIAYTHGTPGYSDTEIYVMNADGTGQTNLTGTLSYSWGPSWSPDGTKIAYMSSRSGHTEIYVMNADGSGQTKLTHGASNNDSNSDPAWSPDSKKIVFMAFIYAESSNEVRVMNADGSGIRKLTDILGTALAWSPDGARIAIANGDIYVINADGSGAAMKLTTNGFCFEPDWSPDGAMIAYTQGFPGYSGAKIYLMNADGSGQRKLTNMSSFSPAWSDAPIP